MVNFPLILTLVRIKFDLLVLCKFNDLFDNVKIGKCFFHGLFIKYKQKFIEIGVDIV